MCDNLSKMELLDNFKPNDSQLKNENNRNKQHKIREFKRLHINKEDTIDK